MLKRSANPSSITETQKPKTNALMPSSPIKSKPGLAGIISVSLPLALFISHQPTTSPLNVKLTIIVFKLLSSPQIEFW